MKLLLILLSSLALGGCATGCREACLLGFGPGNAMFDTVARQYNTQDACQHLGKPIDYQLPSFCGAGRGYREPIYIYNQQNQRIATVK